MDVERAAALVNAVDRALLHACTIHHVDAWFAGFNGKLVAVTWIGFDTPANLGPNETGSQAALPIWMGYAGKVLKGVPETEISAPSGVVTVAINPATGLRDPSPSNTPGRITEYFYQESQPPVGDDTSIARDGTRHTEEVKSQIF